MKIRLLVAAANIGFMFLLVVGAAAKAAEIRVLSAIGIQAVMEDLEPKFERATGHKLAITFGNLGSAVKRVQSGETFDVVIIPRPGIDGFLKDGKAEAGNVSVVARSSIGVVVRKGAPRPDISSPEALKRTLLAAKSIAYSDPARGGPAGAHFAKVLDRLGIANEMKAKTIFPNVPDPVPPVTVGLMVANGEAEIGVNQIQELVPVVGIEVVGPLPGDLESSVVFAAVVMAGTRNVEASQALVNFLRTPEAAAVIKAKGLEPATP